MVEDKHWGDIDALALSATNAVLERLGLEPSIFEISLLACNDARIAVLNEDFRGKPQPTNVLSWPSDERAAAVDGEMPLAPRSGRDTELGDIAISFLMGHFHPR